MARSDVLTNPLQSPIRTPTKADSLALILFSILTEEGQPILTEESGLIQTE